jgi:nucleotidyltransferase substrate binding protein (TIGR01987 family)
MISTTALHSALAELDRNLRLLTNTSAASDPALRRTFGMASIQAFEICYELSIKLIRRSLEAKASTPEVVDALDFRELMRAAAEAGLVDDPMEWMKFRVKRNITSHTYDEAKALDVLEIIPHFNERAQSLLAHQVTAILRKRMPAGVHAFVFGSRAHGRGLKPFSDLDLCLRGDAPVAQSIVESLIMDFAESDLPIRVDVADWFALSQEFQGIIAKDLCPLQMDFSRGRTCYRPATIPAAHAALDEITAIDQELGLR